MGFIWRREQFWRLHEAKSFYFLSTSLPTASEGWGKVMFSHVSVCLSTPPPTCYTAVGMPLAFTQEDFLVWHFNFHMQFSKLGPSCFMPYEKGRRFLEATGEKVIVCLLLQGWLVKLKWYFYCPRVLQSNVFSRVCLVSGGKRFLSH